MNNNSEADEPVDDMPAEYDLSTLKNGVRGKYAQRMKEGTNVVFLAPDLVQYFPDGDAVNAALRSLVNIANASIHHAK